MINLRSAVIIAAVYIVGTACLRAGQTCPATGFSYLVDYYNCSAYYECNNGIKIHRQCPPGFYWNDIEDQCDFPENVDCSRTHTTTPGTGPTPITTTTPKPTTPGDICSGKPDGTYIADPIDCHKFYECVAGVGLQFTCPAGTSWNESILTCDTSNPDC